MVSQFILNVVVMKSDKINMRDKIDSMFHPTDHVYNPERDLKAVEPMLAIDLKEVYVTGIIPTQVPSFVDRYNNCDDPNAVVGRPRNDFDADRIISSVNAGIREAKSAETGSEA